jgi:hypothetical protein
LLAIQPGTGRSLGGVLADERLKVGQPHSGLLLLDGNACSRARDAAGSYLPRSCRLTGNSPATTCMWSQNM